MSEGDKPPLLIDQLLARVRHRLLHDPAYVAETQDSLDRWDRDHQGLRRPKKAQPFQIVRPEAPEE
jgi:hypothetical protein